MTQPITKLICARWVLPISSPVIEDGAVAMRGGKIEAVGRRQELSERYRDATVEDFGEAAILPGLVNAHTHLELTAMRGFLDAHDLDFTAWLQKLTVARAERMTDEDIATSATLGVMEALRSGVTTVADAATNGVAVARTLRSTGIRAIVYQESFGPDPRVAEERAQELAAMVSRAREFADERVTIGISPHAPYSVSAPQLSRLGALAHTENLPVMMHAAESADEVAFLHDSSGRFGDGLRHRGIEWQNAGCSTITHLERNGILGTRPLLAHCVTVDADDIQLLARSGAGVAHCPKSNAKLGHGVAPLAELLEAGVPVGLASDSVASNNLVDLFEEARFALFQSRIRERGTEREGMLDAEVALNLVTLGGARALGIDRQIGSLEPGKQADLVAVSLNGAHQRPVYDPMSTLVFATRAADVVWTMIGGDELYRNGRFTTIDTNAIDGALDRLREKLAQ